jgi:hypothetical protein
MALHPSAFIPYAADAALCIRHYPYELVVDQLVALIVPAVELTDFLADSL